MFGCRCKRKVEKDEKTLFIEWLISTNTEGMFSLIAYLEQNGFFRAPCSAGHHLNITGGLLTHSLTVLKLALALKTNCDIPISKDSIIKTALLHDVFKMFLYEYKKGKWQYIDFEKEYNTLLEQNPKKEHGEWAVRIIESFIKLTDQEKEMIKWHMGPYTEYYDNHKPGDFLEWSNDKKNKNKNAALFLYFCDHLSSMYLEG